MKTKVSFKMFKNEVIAIFPNEFYNERLYGNSQLMSYMRVGQHSACSKDLLKCRNAKSVQYEALKKELESLGYDLTVKGA